MSEKLSDYFGSDTPAPAAAQEPQADATDKVEKPPKKKQSKSSFEDRRRAARVAAVQALYQLDQSTKPDVLAVLRDFVLFRAKEDLEGLRLGKFDKNLFQDIVAGVWQNQVAVDDMMTAILPVDWRTDRIDPVMKAIMRCGIYEIENKPDLPTAIVIGEYVSVSYGFFDGNEPNVINAGLDTIAKTLRDGELLDL